MSVIKALKGFNRLKKIANLLFKEELGFLVDKLKLKSHLDVKHKLKSTEFKKPITALPTRLRRVMEDAGGAFVKLGQLLSLRSDLLPKEYCEEFAKLQDEVKPFPFKQVKQTIELELGKPLNKVFKEFNPIPIAAASVGQVHKAKLNTGEVVAVKIQRPGIVKTFETDIDILHYLSKVAYKHIPESRPFKLQKIVEVFEEYTEKELDYLKEGKNIELIYQRSKNTKIKIPKVYWDHTSSKVLTMEFVDGKRIKQVKLTKPERKKIADTISNALINQIFDYHIFHADPHPGNIFLTKNKNVAFLDFGIVGRVSPDMQDHIEDMMVGLVQGDLDLLSRSFMEMGIIEGEINENQFKEDLFQKWGQYHGENLNKINMKEFFEDTFELARKYNMEYPTNFILLLKSLATAEGLYRYIYPESNFIRIIRPKTEEIMLKRKNLKNIAKEFKKNAWSVSRTVKKFPEDLRSLVRLIKRGTKVYVDIDNRDVQTLTHEIGTSSNRLAFGFIIGGLVVAFGLVVLAGIEPTLWGVPYIGILLLFIIMVLSLLLGISILWEKKGGEL